MIRNGVIAVIFKKKGKHFHFAVLEKHRDWSGWEFVKGGVESSEDEVEAIKREIKEETGIEKFVKIEKLEKVNNWSYRRDGKLIQARYTPYLVEVPEDSRIKISQSDSEHKQGFFLNFRDAKDILRYQNMKDILEEAMEKLKN